MIVPYHLLPCTLFVLQTSLLADYLKNSNQNPDGARHITTVTTFLSLSDKEVYDNNFSSQIFVISSLNNVQDDMKKSID